MTSSPRRTEIDLARTAAILGMVLYHLLFDLHAWYGWQTDVTRGGWQLFAYATASVFLLLSGLSFTLAGNVTTSSRTTWQKAMRRFAIIGGAAALVTSATWFIDSQSFVRFGILHLLAVSTLLLPLTRKWKTPFLLAFAVFLFALGFFVSGKTADTALLLPFGILPKNFFTVDYYPLLPWYGVILCGCALGRALYLDHQPRPLLQGHFWTKLALPGRHSLLIYLVHQPLLLGALYLILGPWQ